MESECEFRQMKNHKQKTVFDVSAHKHSKIYWKKIITSVKETTKTDYNSAKCRNPRILLNDKHKYEMCIESACEWCVGWCRTLKSNMVYIERSLN